MQLSVRDRILLLETISQQRGDITKLRILQQLQDKLGFTEDEHKKYNFVTHDGQLSWVNNEEIEIAIGDIEKQIIKDALKLMDERKNLTMQYIELYEKFMDEN